MVLLRSSTASGIALLFALSACTATFGGAGDTDCGAARLSAFVGQPVVEVAAIETPGPVRILEPDSVMTHDFVPDRLNIFTDEDGIVTQLTCG